MTGFNADPCDDHLGCDPAHRRPTSNDPRNVVRMAALLCTLPSHSLLQRRPNQTAVTGGSGICKGRAASQYHASTSSPTSCTSACSDGQQLRRRGRGLCAAIPAVGPAQSLRQPGRRCRAARHTALPSMSPLAIAVLAPAMGEVGTRPLARVPSHRHHIRTCCGASAGARGDPAALLVPQRLSCFHVQLADGLEAPVQLLYLLTLLGFLAAGAYLVVRQVCLPLAYLGQRVVSSSIAVRCCRARMCRTLCGMP